MLSASAPPIGTEALDGPSCPATLARATLADIVLVNTLFGGRQATAYGLARIAALVPRRDLTLLDVGAGSGDIARYLQRRALRHGIHLRPVALDLHPTAAALSRASGLPSIIADAGALPIGDRSVDLVVASQILHHLSRAAAVQVLRRLHRVARVGVIVADLRRSTLAATGIWLASFPLRLHRVTRHDGVLSVRRGFARRELADLLAAAGIRARVHRRPGFRLVAAWTVDHAHS